MYTSSIHLLPSSEFLQPSNYACKTDIKTIHKTKLKTPPQFFINLTAHTT